MRVKNWQPQIIKDYAETATKADFDKAAEAVAANVRRHCPIGTISRPMYRRGPYAGQYWTARDAGTLRRSIRVTRRDRGLSGLIFRAADVRVYVGHKKAWYARIVEFYTPFVRPALFASLPLVKQILGAK